VVADAPTIYLAGQQAKATYSKSVKNLGLVLNNAFSWKNQVNQDSGALHHTHLWELGGVVYCKTSAGLRHKLHVAGIQSLF
jgi:hypothetical protein